MLDYARKTKTDKSNRNSKITYEITLKLKQTKN